MQWSAVFDNNFKKYLTLNVGVYKNGFSFPKEEHDDRKDERGDDDDDPAWGQ